MKLRISNPPNEGFNWGKAGDAIDTKKAAQYLQKIGLVGADQIKEAQPNIADPNSIRTSQADWKIAAIQHIISNAKKFGIRKPEEVIANKDVLMSTLDPKYKDAINNSSFGVTHPNFWGIISHSILPDEYAKETTKLLVKK